MTLMMVLLKKIIKLQTTMSYITSKNNFLKTEQFLSEVLPVDVLEYFSKVSFSTYVVGGSVRIGYLAKGLLILI